MRGNSSDIERSARANRVCRISRASKLDHGGVLEMSLRGLYRNAVKGSRAHARAVIGFRDR